MEVPRPEVCLVLVTVGERRKLRWTGATLLLDPVMLIQSWGLGCLLYLCPAPLVLTATPEPHDEGTEAQY